HKSPADRAGINRENARLSTGPRTDKGKATAAFQKRFFDDLQPVGIIEVQLTQTLADCSWRLNCARAYETNLLTLGAEEQAQTIQVDDAEIHYALATLKAIAIRCAHWLRSACTNSAFPASSTAASKSSVKSNRLAANRNVG